MIRFGYKLMTEEHGPKALIENSVRAEAAGFDFVSISDHFHPWLEAQGHSPFAWSVLGGIAQATATIGLTTGLTCPIIRYHPAIVAQAAATIAILSDDRFTLAVGAGERLNEHITGARWPSIPERHAMLGEAIDIFRMLWSGGVHSHAGEHYVIDHAQLYDAPAKAIPVVVGVSGKHSVALAAEKADGVMATEPKAALVEGFRQAKRDGPAYAEALTAWGRSAQDGLDNAHRIFAFSKLGWAVNSEVPTVAGFESACQWVRPDDMKDGIGLGPDVDSHVEAVRAYVDAGFDHIVLTCPGQDQAGFISFFEKELRPALKKLG